MNYKVRIRRGYFNWLNPDEVQINHWIGIYDEENEKPIKVLNVDTDDGDYLFSKHATPEEIADALQNYLNSYFTTQRKEIEDMIKFLREHSKELLESKLKELKDLEERKEK